MRLVLALLFGFVIAACGGPVTCAPDEVPNEALQACVIPKQCDGGTVNERNECVLEQPTEAADAGDAGESTTGGPAGRAGGSRPIGRQETGTGIGGTGGMLNPAGHTGSSGSGGTLTTTPVAGVEAGTGGAAGGTSMPAGTDGSSAAAGGAGGSTGTSTTGGRGGSGGGGGGGGGGTAGTTTPTTGGQGGGGAMSAMPVCGNGKVEGDELCDGDCPTACEDDGNACSKDEVMGSASACTAQCVHTPITTPNGAVDGCCPSGGTPTNDGDCPLKLMTTSTTLYKSCDLGNSICDGDSKCVTNLQANPTASQIGVCLEKCQVGVSQVQGADGLGNPGRCYSNSWFWPTCETVADCPGMLTACRMREGVPDHKYCFQD